METTRKVGKISTARQNHSIKHPWQVSGRQRTNIVYTTLHGTQHKHKLTIMYILALYNFFSCGWMFLHG